ncbi:MAG TPA: ATP-binding cassette domain-containing protein [bacterium]
MIQVQGVTKAYQRLLPIFDDVSFAIDKGEFVYLTGVSGAGKTTVFRLLMLMERPDKGNLVLEDRTLGKLRVADRAKHRRRIGMVFQDYRLLPGETIAENVGLPLRVAGVNAAMEHQKVMEKLEQVGMAERANERVVGLSGGEKQLVAIARALVFSPPVLFADEPTGNLDQGMAYKVMELLQGIHKQGCTVVVATHDLPMIRAFRARTLLIRDRKVHEVRVVDGPAEQKG